jgi:hypothetical protein
VLAGLRVIWKKSKRKISNAPRQDHDSSICQAEEGKLDKHEWSQFPVFMIASAPWGLAAVAV